MIGQLSFFKVKSFLYQKNDLLMGEANVQSDLRFDCSIMFKLKTPLYTVKILNIGTYMSEQTV